MHVISQSKIGQCKAYIEIGYSLAVRKLLI